MTKPSPSPTINVLVAVAWPYAQGPLHLGHIGGAYLPSDVFARFQRSIGNDVLMVSGSDTHGTPITVRAEEEGVTAEEIVARFHPEFLQYWEDLGISFDLFTKTDTENHKNVAQDFFLTLNENGFLYTKASDQYYDAEAERFLPDRYVEGTCPHCGYSDARGDQCDNCGRTLDPADLIDPRSRFTGATPVMRSTEHYYLRFTALQDQMSEWLASRKGWRPHVKNFAVGFVEEGLKDRAFTRDMDWGIPIPVDDLGDGKVIYVWWEAVMGYLSAAKEWAASSGDPEAWKRWWENPDAEAYYFVGKDNVPFHAIFWPAMLMGYGGLNLPTDVPANQYITFKGEKASKSRGVGKSLRWYLDHVEPDALRYALAANFPENSDSDLVEDDMWRRINDELVATWGNLVHRVVSMTHRYFDGVVPDAIPDDRDQALLDRIDELLLAEHTDISNVRLRSGLVQAMSAAQEANVYLSEREPWKTAKTDTARTGTTLNVALQAIAGIAVGLSPYLPFTSPKVLASLGIESPEDGPVWGRPQVDAGTVLAAPEPLFSKVEIEDEE